MRRAIGIGAAGVLAYLATGLAVVGQDEVGVVRRFGAVAPPVASPFAAGSADAALALAAESALTRALARRGIDDVLTTGRAEVAEAMQAAIQQESDRAGLGVSIRAVRLGRVAPPVAVA